MGALSYYMRPSTATEPGNDGVLPGRWRPVDTENGSGYGKWLGIRNMGPFPEHQTNDCAVEVVKHYQIFEINKTVSAPQCRSMQIRQNHHIH